MRKRSNKKKPAEAEQAVQPISSPTVNEAPPEPTAGSNTPGGKNPAAVALGRLGGKKGGPARAKKLTKEQRSKIAKKAAQTRWANRSRQ